jgi:DNA repair exonuclease SbcCD nuclease subunit
MKIALVTDTHVGVRGDSDTFADYQDKFWYGIFFPYLEENGITDIIHLGDITDRRKWINYKTLNRFRDLIHKMADEYSLRVIIGNHDTYYKNTNEVNSMNCLFDGGFSAFSEPREVYLISSQHEPILFVPWINASNYDKTMEMIEKTTASVCMGHLNLHGFEMARGLLNAEGMDHRVFKKFDMVFSGHFHKRSHRDNIWYLGSPFEQTWIDYGEERGFHIFDTETHDLEFVPNPYKMFYKIFYDGMECQVDPSDYTGRAVKVIVNKIDDQYLFDRFIEELENASPWHMQIIDNTDGASGPEDLEVEHIESKGTLELLNDYVDQSTYENKDDVKSLMRNLFDDVISSEQ